MVMLLIYLASDYKFQSVPKVQIVHMYYKQQVLRIQILNIYESGTSSSQYLPNKGINGGRCDEFVKRCMTMESISVVWGAILKIYDRLR